MQLEEVLKGIEELDEKAMEKAQKQWNSIAKPLHSLGKLERYIIQIAGMTGDANVRLDRRALIIMCADNGVVACGVTQTGQDVTAIVSENFLKGATSAAIMCKRAGVDIFPIDIGMAVDTIVPNYKIAYGTKNMAVEPAMTRDEAVRAMMTGIELVKEKKEAGYQIIATGEMGIGNTTTSSAVASVLLGKSVDVMTGRGAGLTSEGLEHKVQVIKEAIEKHRPNWVDPIDVVAKVGGFDLAGLAGVYLGCAYYHLPVIMDGFISAVAALIAVRLCKKVKDYIIVSHVSKEPGMNILLNSLGLEASLNCEMCLGEGTGAVAFLPILDLALDVYHQMSTFSEISIDEYQELK